MSWFGTHCPLKKVYRKRLVRSLLVLIPLLVIAGILLYIKLSGFKKALEQLVDAESSGQYSLVINKSSIGITNLSFTFNDLTIRRNSEASGRGIDVVHIPYLQIRFGSIASMLMVKQFDIESCIIQEPVIEINAEQKRGEGVTLSQQIVQLYPAIEALLGRFDIKSLKIMRASVGMKKLPSSLTLNLVDLLVEEWNMQSLTDASQLRLNVGGQELDFGKADLQFSGIEFNFQKHHLLFSDFNFISEDTVSDSRILVSGKSLVLKQLDYKDLYENKRYSIKKAQIDSPNVTVHFRLKKRDTTKVRDRAMLARILRHTVGECSVDSTIIRDARVHIVAQQGDDSVRIDLPRVNFRAHGFKVTQDTSSFQLGEIEIDLNRTAIELKKDMSLHCDRIFFDRYQDLTLTNVVLFDSLKHESIATCDKLRLNYFNVLNYIFYKNVTANTISLENARIQFTPDGERTPERGNGKRQALNKVAIRNVSLRNVTVHYVDQQRRLTLDRLSMFMTDLKGDGLQQFDYTIKTIQLQSATHVSKAASALQSKIKNLSFDGRSFSLNEIDLRKDSLHIHIKNVVAEKTGDEPIQKNYKQWKSAEVKSLNITGTLPKNDEKGPAVWRGISFGIGKLKVRHLQTSLRDRKMSLTSEGENIVLQNLAIADEGIRNGEITGSFSNVLVTTPSTKVHVDNVSVQLPSLVNANGVEIREDDLAIGIPSVTVHEVVQHDGSWLLKTIRTKQVTVTKDSQPILLADSVMLLDARLANNNEPVLGRFEVFNPAVTLTEQSNEGTPEKGTILPIPNHIIIHPGILHLSNGEQLSFGKIHHDKAKSELTCGFVQGKTEKMQVRLSDLSLRPDQFRIDSIKLWPDEKWFQENGWEDDLVEADLYGVRVNNVSIMDFLKTKRIKNAAVTLDGFVLNVKRDKRRIDPPEKEKPATLSGLLKLPQEIGIKAMVLSNGRIRYTEISEITGAEGVVELEEISATAEFDTTFHVSPKTLKAKGKLYNAGAVDLHYTAVDPNTFKLNVVVKDFDLTHLNKVVVPLQSLNIKSGRLMHYDLLVTADRDRAVGDATISYKGLHLEIYKRSAPDKKTLGTELLTLLADGIILKHSKANAMAPVNQPRLKHKSIFNYWIKASVHGAMSAVRKGKSVKNRKASRKDS